MTPVRRREAPGRFARRVAGGSIGSATTASSRILAAAAAARAPSVASARADARARSAPLSPSGTRRAPTRRPIPRGTRAPPLGRRRAAESGVAAPATRLGAEHLARLAGPHAAFSAGAAAAR